MKKLNIVYLDDDAALLQCIEDLFGRDHVIHTTEIPDQAIAWIDLGRNKIDLIITDLEMPRMNGIKFAEKVRPLTDAPIVLVTGADDVPPLSSKAESAGICEIFYKPLVRRDFEKMFEIARGTK